MTVTHKLTMDFTKVQNLQRIEAVQGDSCSRFVALTLLENGSPWLAPKNAAVMIRYRKPDGTGGCYDTMPDETSAWSFAGNVLTIALAPQMFTCPGCVQAQAELIQGNRSLATFTFQVAVEPDPSLGTRPSEDYISWSQWAQVALLDVLKQAKESGEFDGAVFTPSVSEDGNLSWSNDQGLENPAAVSLRDPKCLHFSLGALEPEETHILWFNTSITGAADAAVLLLSENVQDAVVTALVGDTQYGIENATVNQAPTANTYDFTIL